MKEMLKLQASICKTFGNPNRLHIIKLLCKSSKTASELIAETGMSKANLSQHMAMLVNKGIVDSVKNGQNVSYSLADKKIGTACSIMQEVTVNTISKKHKIVKKAAG